MSKNRSSLEFIPGKGWAPGGQNQPAFDRFAPQHHYPPHPPFSSTPTNPLLHLLIQPTESTTRQDTTREGCHSTPEFPRTRLARSQRTLPRGTGFRRDFFVSLLSGDVAAAVVSTTLPPRERTTGSTFTRQCEMVSGAAFVIPAPAGGSEGCDCGKLVSAEEKRTNKQTKSHSRAHAGTVYTPLQTPPEPKPKQPRRCRL